MEREKLVSLVTAAQQGDQVALNDLFNAFYNDVYYFALKTVKDEQQACDVTQETFVEVIGTIDHLQEPAAFVTWLKRIAYHQCTRYFRKKKDVLVDEDEDGYTIFDTLQEEKAEFIPDEALNKDDFKQTILAMIDELSEEQRAAVLMFYFDELSVKQIADIQGVSENTVKSRLNYARKGIKASVEEYEKKHGVKLHCVGVLPLLLWLFKDYFSQALPASAATVAEGVAAATGTAITVTATATTAATATVGATAVAATATTAATTVSVATATTVTAATVTVKAVAVPLAVKIVAGVLAATVAVGGGTAAVMHVSNSRVDDEERVTKTTTTSIVGELVPGTSSSSTGADTAETGTGDDTTETVTGDNTTETVTGDDTTETGTKPTASTTSPNPEVEVWKWVVPQGGRYSTGGRTYLEGATIMTFPKTGDTFETADYTYRYEYAAGYEEDATLWRKGNTGGWGVLVNDTTKTTYSALLSSINGRPLLSMSSTFRNCRNMTTAPSIPSGVTNLFTTFMDCSSLTAAPRLPDSVEEMSHTFAGCTSLTTVLNLPSAVINLSAAFSGCDNLTAVPALPNGVRGLAWAFQGCTSLKTISSIPASVEDMIYTFFNCSSLTGTIEIHAVLADRNMPCNGTCETCVSEEYDACDLCIYCCSYTECFGGVEMTKPITLTGTSPYLQELADTARNDTVTVS